jgi:hypothetical protein
MHNLVTIRLDFEIQKHPLPAVYHKLCWLLTNVLHGHYRLIEWHEQRATNDDKNAVWKAIHVELQSRRASVWNSCVKVLEECTEEYIKYVGKKKLFEWKGNEHLDEDWLEDLEGLEDVLRLTDQFLSLRNEFLEGVPLQFINDGSMLSEKLSTIFKKHLRTFHVEAMNTMGLTLYREDWTLIPLKSCKVPSSDVSVDGQIHQVSGIRNFDKGVFGASF